MNMTIELDRSISIPRVAFLMLLVASLGGNFVVEQPRSSLLFQHERMVWLCNQIKVPVSDSIKQPKPFSVVPMPLRNEAIAIAPARSTGFPFGWASTKLLLQSLQCSGRRLRQYLASGPVDSI